MKNLKFMMLLVLSVALCSCDNSDDSDGGGDPIPRNVDFQATINGGAFTDYQFVLGTYYADSTEGTLIISVTDSNANIVRIFINETNNLGTSTENIIGDESIQGFINTVTVQDQANSVTYTSVSGSITILENVISANENGISYITGDFEIVLNSETSTDSVTLNGAFADVRFVNQM
ncbi:hypothetical protein [Psychroserpens sp.]